MNQQEDGQGSSAPYGHAGTQADRRLTSIDTILSRSPLMLTSSWWAGDRRQHRERMSIINNVSLELTYKTPFTFHWLEPVTWPHADARITKKYGCESNTNFPVKTRHDRRQVQNVGGDSSLPHLRLLIASNSPKELCPSTNYSQSICKWF